MNLHPRPPFPFRRNPCPGRSDFPHFLAIPTRWMDNDVYGHVNNVVYYSYFDTVINEYLIREGGLDIHDGAAIGYCVESQCRYLAPLAFPEIIDAGLRVAHLGKSSVRYEIALFRQGDDVPAAVGISCMYSSPAKRTADRDPAGPARLPRTPDAALNYRSGRACRRPSTGSVRTVRG
jgi:acyl-CoA thioester hydrolase